MDGESFWELEYFLFQELENKILNKNKDKNSNGRHDTSLTSHNCLMLAFTQLKVVTTSQIVVRTVVSIAE